MIEHDCKQYSSAWWALRLGIPTGSRFASIIQGKKLKPSTGRYSLISDLIIETRFQKPADYKEGDEEFYNGFEESGTPWMKRGTEIEGEARRWYSAHTGNKVREVGFITNDEGTAGCSPDGLVGKDGGLEIKARSAKQHLRIILGYDDIADPAQVMGSLIISERKWWDVLAYCPGLPSRLVRYYRDPTFAEAWGKAFQIFQDDFKEAQEALDRIEEDVVEGDNLKALFSGALQKKPTQPNPHSVEDLAEFGKAIDRCVHLKLMDATDFLRIIDDIWAEDWESVDGMITYTTRLLETSTSQLEIA